MDITAIIWVTVLLVLAGAFDGVRDTLMFHYSQTGFAPNHRFWSPEVSWKNKWKQGDLFTTPRDITAMFWLSNLGIRLQQR